MSIQTTHTVERTVAEKIAQEIVLRLSQKPDFSWHSNEELEEFLEKHDPSIFRNYAIVRDGTLKENTNKFTPIVNSTEDYFMYGEPKK